MSHSILSASDPSQPLSCRTTSKLKRRTAEDLRRHEAACDRLICAAIKKLEFERRIESARESARSVSGWREDRRG